MINKMHNYDNLEFLNEDDVVVGSIWMHGDEFMYAEIDESFISNNDTLADVREFLDYVDNKMNGTGADEANAILAPIIKDIVGE